jgi:hypothetical protein
VRDITSEDVTDVVSQSERSFTQMAEDEMKTFNRKGNWNEIAGTAKHRLVTRLDKAIKKDTRKEPVKTVPKKSGKTENAARKQIVKSV